MRLKTFSLLSLFLFCSSSAVSAAGNHEEALQDPLVLGGWLYKSRCVRCHTDYDEEHLAADFTSLKELTTAIGSRGCRISWGRNHGGPFKQSELRAIATFMLEWEEQGEEPSLPELPPLLPEDVVEIERTPPASQKIAVVPVKSGVDALPAPLHTLVKTNPVAEGGWLYTNQCYRCHLAYHQGRQGRGMARELLLRIIREGKTSTQMKPFSRLLGGELKNKEIESIVAYITAWEKAGEPLAIAGDLMQPPALDPADFKPLRLPRFPEVEGDRKNGRKIFVHRCVRCHGTSGEGGIGPSFEQRQWVVRPDLFVKSVVKTGVPGSPMVSWDQGKGGPLSAKEIDDVTTFVLSLAQDSE